MFTLTGLILRPFGSAARGNVDLYAKIQGINANLWWEVVLLAFGLACLSVAITVRGSWRTTRLRHLKTAKCAAATKRKRGSRQAEIRCTDAAQSIFRPVPEIDTALICSPLH